MAMEDSERLVPSSYVDFSGQIARDNRISRNNHVGGRLDGGRQGGDRLCCNQMEKSCQKMNQGTNKLVQQRQ